MLATTAFSNAAYADPIISTPMTAAPSGPSPDTGAPAPQVVGRGYTRKTAALLGIGSIALGAASLGGGAAMWVGAHPSCCDEPPAQMGFAAGGVALMVSGGLGVLTGVVVLATMPSKDEAATPTVALAVRPGALTLRGTF